MKRNVYIISVLVVVTIHTVSECMEAPGKEKKSLGTQEKRRVNDNALLEAARKGDNAQIISLLEYGSNIDTTDPYCFQPLHWAAKFGHTATVELLLDRGATGIDTPDKKGWQSIHLAAYNGHTATVELLLDRGASGIDVPDECGRQPIHCAAWDGHTAIVELLLDREATGIDVPDKEGWQPIHFAAVNGHTATIRLLLDRGVTGIDVPDNGGKQPIHFAAEGGHTATMIILIAHGVTIPDILTSTLAEVFAQSDFTCIPPLPLYRLIDERTLTRRGGERTLTLSDVFAMAAGQNKQETVESIVRLHRTDLTESNIINALIGSATAGHDAMVRMLDEEMSNDITLRSLVPETLARALSRAVAHRRADVICYLIEQDSFYDTPTFSLLRRAGTLLRYILSRYSPAEIRSSERLSDNKRILAMLAERQCWRYHTLSLIGRAQAASVGREETVPYVSSPIINIPIELGLIILNYLADRHRYDMAK